MYTTTTTFEHIFDMQVQLDADAHSAQRFVSRETWCEIGFHVWICEGS